METSQNDSFSKVYDIVHVDSKTIVTNLSNTMYHVSN